MNKFIENWLIGTGSTGVILGISVADVKETLWIIYLIIQLSALILGFTIKAIKYYKNDGKIDEEERKDLENDVDKMHDFINKNK